ncbi:unnamed protein product [Mytilus coruscus]|uniref:Uncharacterized protein n=1 Tax=Mytilus coruscus TaxID=42192 RepID=A0A6J8C886_MYTCO|nr:unnamed protein product [Mytilus coruscus]
MLEKMSTENSQTKWCFFGQIVRKAEIVYFCQMTIVFIIVIAAVVNLSTQNGSIELWTNTDSIMVEINDGMEKKLLSTVLLFSFAELLEEMVQQLSKNFCQGCKVKHGSQHRHDCLMDSELDKLEKHFEQAYCEFKYSHILGKYRENVRTLNLENSIVLNFFILHVLFLDTLRSEKMKETVYNLMERKVKLEGRCTQ